MENSVSQVRDHLYNNNQPFAAEFSATATIDIDRRILQRFQPLSDERNLSLSCDAEGDTNLQFTGRAIWNNGKAPNEKNWDRYELNIRIAPTSYTPAFFGKPVGNFFETGNEFSINFDRITGKVQLFQKSRPFEVVSGVCNQEVFYSLILGALECAASQQSEALKGISLSTLKEQFSGNINNARSSLVQLRSCTEGYNAEQARLRMSIKPD